MYEHIQRWSPSVWNQLLSFQFKSVLKTAMWQCLWACDFAPCLFYHKHSHVLIFPWTLAFPNRHETQIIILEEWWPNFINPWGFFHVWTWKKWNSHVWRWKEKFHRLPLTHFSNKFANKTRFRKFVKRASVCHKFLKPKDIFFQKKMVKKSQRFICRFFFFFFTALHVRIPLFQGLHVKILKSIFPRSFLEGEGEGET